jgi:hypothetical protein
MLLCAGVGADVLVHDTFTVCPRVIAAKIRVPIVSVQSSFIVDTWLNSWSPGSPWRHHLPNPLSYNSQLKLGAYHPLVTPSCPVIAPSQTPVSHVCLSSRIKEMLLGSKRPTLNWTWGPSHPLVIALYFICLFHYLLPLTFFLASLKGCSWRHHLPNALAYNSQLKLGGHVTPW